VRVPLRDGDAASNPLDVDVLALDAALQRLAESYPRQGQLVELRFFGGLTVEETAAVLGVAPITVKRDWPLAKAWLYREILGLRHDGTC
jgi:DNA-directed RNA polymerase specialized sigma24 family protein